MSVYRNAYLQFGESPGPFLTTRVRAKQDLGPWRNSGLKNHQTAIGPKQPTSHKVLFDRSWRRVYLHGTGSCIVLDGKAVPVTWQL